MATIKIKRGLHANLPPEAGDGELLFTTDKYELWVGRGVGQSLEKLTINIDDLQNLIDDKASSSHTHAISDVTGLQAALDDKVSSSNLGTAASKNTGTSSGNVPELDADGKLSTSVLPAIAITDTFEVSSQSAMLALTAEKGDVAVRSDINKSFVLSSSPASTLANWIELKTPTDTVLSVNGQTGAVTLTANDFGAASSSHTHTFASLTSKPTTLSGYGITDAASGTHSHTISNITDLQTTLDGKASSSHTHTISNVTGLQTALDGKANTSHTHAIVDVTGLQGALDGKANTSHTQAATTVTFSAPSGFPTSPNATPNTAQLAIENLFQSANSGKTAIAGAIGSPATSSETFSQLATHITTGKQQIATATGNPGVSGSSTFTQLASAVSALSSPTFGVIKDVLYDEAINAGDIVESTYRTLSLETTGISIGSQPTGTANAVTWSTDNSFLAIGHSTAPRLTVYKRDSNTYTAVSGVSAAFTGHTNGVAFSGDNNYLVAVGNGTTNSIRVYKRNYGTNGDTFTFLSSAFTEHPGQSTYSCAFSPDGNLLAAGHVINASSISVSVYQKTNTDTFTRLTITQPTNDCLSVAWSPDGAYLVAGTQNDATFLHIWSRSGTTLTKLTNSSVFDVMPSAAVRSVSYSPDGNYLALALNADPFIAVYKRTGATTYQQITTPSVKPSNIANSVSWSPDGAYLTVAHNVSPFFTTYKLKNDVLTNQANPSTLPTTTGNACAWSPNANSLAVVNASGGTQLTVYNNNSTTYLFNKANTNVVNPLDKIIGIAKQTAAANTTTTRQVDVLVGRSLLP